MPFFLGFFGRPFFDPQSTFERPRCRKGHQKGTKMEAEGTLKAFSGMCKKHGRGCIFNTFGHVGESPGGDFFQNGFPDPFWKDPGEHFIRFLLIFVIFGGRFWFNFRVKCATFLGTTF